MSDLYREILIQRETPVTNKILRVVLMALVALCAVAGVLITPLLLLAAIALGAVLWVFVIPKLEVEYEYLYVNGELDIDAIYSKQKRKRVAGYDMQELEILAPSNSHALDSYLNGQGVKVKDFTSGRPQEKSYTLVLNQEKGREIIKVELDDVIVSDIRRINPRKVNLI
ncbi:MAG: DUF6106 family protein [Lachnospiraceae bacterium]|nr:DUF6106 family protein [Lachnospiraceae bacterium]